MRETIIRTTLAAVVAVALLSPAAAETKPSTEAASLFKTGLDRFCPKRRLDWLDPDSMAQAIDAYYVALPEPLKADFDKATKRDLAKCGLNAKCFIGVEIRAVHKSGGIAHMAQRVCEVADWTCIAPGQCTGGQ